MPHEWLQCGCVCPACLRIPKDWRAHNEQHRLRRHLLRKFPTIRVIVRGIDEDDYSKANSVTEAMQFSPVQKNRDVVVNPEDPEKYDRKFWSYLYVMPGIGVSDYATNRVYYFVIIYLASKLTEPQAVGKDELFHNHTRFWPSTKQNRSS